MGIRDSAALLKALKNKVTVMKWRREVDFAQFLGVKQTHIIFSFILLSYIFFKEGRGSEQTHII